MSYRLNGKNLSIARLIPRGKTGESRLKYLHASSKGTAVVSPVVVARVSLPAGEPQPSNAVIWTQEELDTLPHVTPESGEVVDMPEGRPAVTGPDFLVPVIDKVFPEPSEQVASFTVNAEILLKVLKVVCEVSTDADKPVRLRICPESGTLRVDAYRQPGQQEFIAVIRELEYYGQNIPGEKAEGDTTTVVEVKPAQATLGLKATTGRKFRG